MGRVRERCGSCEGELARLAAEHAAQENIVSMRQAEIASTETMRAELEQTAASAHDKLVVLRENRDLTEQSVAEDKALVATLEERHRSAASVLTRLAQLVSEMQTRVNSLMSQIESAGLEKAQRTLENTAIADKLT